METSKSKCGSEFLAVTVSIKSSNEISLREAILIRNDNYRKTISSDIVREVPDASVVAPAMGPEVELRRLTLVEEEDDFTLFSPLLDSLSEGNKQMQTKRMSRQLEPAEEEEKDFRFPLELDLLGGESAVGERHARGHRIGCL